MKKLSKLLIALALGLAAVVGVSKTLTIESPVSIPNDL